MSIVTVDRAWTTDPALGIIFEMVPSWPDVDAAMLTTATLRPSDESLPTAVGVLIPTTSGSVTCTEGQATVFVVPFSITVIVWHGTDVGEAPSLRNPTPGYM